MIFKKLKKHFFPKWEDIERYDTSWKERIRIMSSLIPHKTKTILDLGAGKQWLMEFIPEDITYIPLDLKKMSEDTIIFNLNNYEFPSIQVDTIFASGVIEYVKDVEWLMERISNCCSNIIISYCILENYPSKVDRRKNGWVNHYSKNSLINLFEEKGFTLKNQIQFQYSILYFENIKNINN